MKVCFEYVKGFLSEAFIRKKNYGLLPYWGYPPPSLAKFQKYGNFHFFSGTFQFGNLHVMKRILYNTRSLCFSLKSSKLMFFSFDALLKGMEGGVIIGEKKLPIFFHVSEHVDHFKAMKFFPLGKKQK